MYPFLLILVIMYPVCFFRNFVSILVLVIMYPFLLILVIMYPVIFFRNFVSILVLVIMYPFLTFSVSLCKSWYCILVDSLYVFGCGSLDLVIDGDVGFETGFLGKIFGAIIFLPWVIWVGTFFWGSGFGLG